MKKTKPTKRELKMRASIAKANRAYKKATPSQRRVMIAQDVLDRLKANKIVASCGTFVDTPFDYEVESQPLQELLHLPQREPCEVCGIGSLFLSAVAFRNEYNLEYGSLKSNADALHQLKEFSKSQRQLIELAFEQGCGWHRIKDHRTRDSKNGESLAPTAIRRLAVQYRNAHGFEGYSRNHDENLALALAAIMKNIIKHNGRFNPAVL